MKRGHVGVIRLNERFLGSSCPILARATFKVECLCGHVEMLIGAMLRTAGVSENEQIRGLSRRLRCRECDAKGKVDVSIKWAE
jgi:hypothetical protein